MSDAKPTDTAAPRLVSRSVEVVQTVKVTVDESKFTPEFLVEFRHSFFDFDTVDEHVEHLAQLYARGVIGGWPDEFIEGYGPARDFGIELDFQPRALTTEIVS